jgi:amylosucrase
MPGQISSINPAQLTLNRLLPRLEFRFSSAIATHPEEWERFFQRLKANFPRLFHLLRDLYGTQYDFYYHLEELLASLLKSWLERPATLKALDLERENHPDWFLSNQMLGGVCYVDLFARDLTGIRQSIPYFKELGLTYLHLMPSPVTGK